MALAVFLVQLLSSGIFPGTSRGIQLPLNAISFTGWGFRGLLLNEYLDRGPWVCCHRARALLNSDPASMRSLNLLAAYRS